MILTKLFVGRDRGEVVASPAGEGEADRSIDIVFGEPRC
jgi:hypothetical protein